MEKHDSRSSSSSSSWYNVQHVPGDYIFPDSERPRNLDVPHHPPRNCDSGIPVIDLGDPTTSQEQILKAAQEFGFFQVINHGISEDTMCDTMSVCREFFDLVDNKDDQFAAAGTNTILPDDTIYFRSSDYAKNGIHLWKDTLKHVCYPLDQCIHSWPHKPTIYRDVVGKYSIQVRNLALKILEIISKGLELGADYFADELTQMQLLSINHYPPCPDPSLTLGLPIHCDPSLITIILQGDHVSGLQVLKDGQWIGVEPIPNAFVVNIGYQMQIISNGKLRAVEHRAVTNSENARTSIVTFFNPSYISIIEPAKILVDSECNHPRYRAYQFEEFLDNFAENNGDPEICLQDYELP